MEDLFKKFQEEVHELLGEMEDLLFKLEKKPGKLETINTIFRVMHTLKGTCNMFGYVRMGELTHFLETLYDFFRSGQAVITRECFNCSFNTIDVLKNLMVNQDKFPDLKNENEYNNLITIIQKLTENLTSTASSVVQPESVVNTFHISFIPSPDIFIKGVNPVFLFEELSALGKIKIIVNTFNVPLLDKLQTDKCYLSWDIFIATNSSEQVLKDVFLFLDEESKISVSLIAGTDLFLEEEFLEKINNAEKEGIPIETAFISSLKFEKTQNKGIKEENNKHEKTQDQVLSTIRVETSKLDLLMNLVGELVTSQARLSVFAADKSFPDLISISETIEKLTRQLRDNAFDICLIPIENLITRFRRLVRDLSGELNKKIQFVTIGEDTELDKTLIENLSDPVLHILRNSIDHGIESPAERLKKGKPEEGTILFKASYAGNFVHIEISDDGAGIDPQKLKKKAVEKGLIKEDAILNDNQLLELIFLPGFSTAREVTDVSGRGVGMDVVKRKIAEVRGEVGISSEIDKGTTILIKLPLTLSIIDGLLVKAGDTFIIIPLTSVYKCFEVTNTEMLMAFNNQLVIEGSKIPFFSLLTMLETGADHPDINQMVVVSYENQQVGIVVDEIIGEYQAVLKPLGKMYKHQKIMAGATILGDGTIALVMDIPGAIKQFESQAKLI